MKDKTTSSSFGHRNTWAMIGTILSFLLFLPGIFFPMFSLDVDAHIGTSFGDLKLVVLSRESSIVATIQRLAEDGKLLVSFLILLFSVLVPVFKGVLVCTAYFARKAGLQRRCHKLASSVAKWSMADVFVVAIFIAFLSTNQAPQLQEHTLSVMGLSIPVKVGMTSLAGLGSGFYFFLGYCLVSIASFQCFQCESE